MQSPCGVRLPTVSRRPAHHVVSCCPPKVCRGRSQKERVICEDGGLVEKKKDKQKSGLSVAAGTDALPSH
jgi:hypothetical protein